MPGKHKISWHWGYWLCDCRERLWQAAFQRHREETKEANFTQNGKICYIANEVLYCGQWGKGTAESLRSVRVRTCARLCVFSACVCLALVCVCVCFAARVGVCLSGGCGDNAAIKKWSLSRDNEPARQGESRERGVRFQRNTEDTVKEIHIIKLFCRSPSTSLLMLNRKTTNYTLYVVGFDTFFSALHRAATDFSINLNWECTASPWGAVLQHSSAWH